MQSWHRRRHLGCAGLQPCPQAPRHEPLLPPTSSIAFCPCQQEPPSFLTPGAAEEQGFAPQSCGGGLPEMLLARTITQRQMLSSSLTTTSNHIALSMLEQHKAMSQHLTEVFHHTSDWDVTTPGLEPLLLQCCAMFCHKSQSPWPSDPVALDGL